MKRLGGSENSGSMWLKQMAQGSKQMEEMLTEKARVKSYRFATRRSLDFTSNGNQ